MVPALRLFPASYFSTTALKIQKTPRCLFPSMAYTLPCPFFLSPLSSTYNHSDISPKVLTSTISPDTTPSYAKRQLDQSHRILPATHRTTHRNLFTSESSNFSAKPRQTQTKRPYKCYYPRWRLPPKVPASPTNNASSPSLQPPWTISTTLKRTYNASWPSPEPRSISISRHSATTWTRKTVFSSRFSHPQSTSKMKTEISAPSTPTPTQQPPMSALSKTTLWKRSAANDGVG